MHEVVPYSFPFSTGRANIDSEIPVYVHIWLYHIRKVGTFEPYVRKWTLVKLGGVA